ncbi:MAG: permease-like cell division protein FtsX [Muribaculaceae bacterium]|nr:permease-like cell division protein FtsX [Muribaculaceae bacterium]MDE6320788.1 permease-like cell division protein FtsX [Muribaculaceae bacterium]
MSKNRKPIISTFSAQFTSTISVALVLLVLGVVVLMGVAARNVVRDIRQNLGFDVVLWCDADQATIDRYNATLDTASYVASYEYVSIDNAIDEWSEMTGEDLRELGDEEIFGPTFRIKVNENYANNDSIKALTESFAAASEVDEVIAHTNMIDDINHNTRSIILVLSVVAMALLLISFVLINNTIRLTIYARRFTIHTMKLVGATPAFIRKPFVCASMLQGFIAGLIAAAVLASLLFYSNTVDPTVSEIITWRDAAIVLGGTVIGGVIICLLAALLATNKYLRLDYDDMFN